MNVIQVRNATLYVGDVLDTLRTLPAESVQCCVTSPPYYGLRDYGVDGQIGLESTPAEYIARMVEVFREVRRVLRPDGTCWVNIGDSYATGAGSGRAMGGKVFGKQNDVIDNGSYPTCQPNRMPLPGLKPKDLIGVPWQLAFALRNDGWYLRSEIIWAKPNPMPESVTDRPTKAHEQIFLLTKSSRYFWDQEAVKEGCEPSGIQRQKYGRKNQWGHIIEANAHSDSRDFADAKSYDADAFASTGRNIRTVWTIATEPTPDAHFATFPSEISRRAILAGTSEKGCCAECGKPWERVVERCMVPDGSWSEKAGKKRADTPGARVSESSMFRTRMINSPQTTGWQPTCTCNADIVPCQVLDPFAGSGTTLAVALKLGRASIGIELNPAYAEIARKKMLRAITSEPAVERVKPLAGQKELFA